MTRDSDRDGKWDTLIVPRDKWIGLDLADAWRYRDLAVMFFKRDFIAFYKQSILGPLWYVIQPVLTALTYFLIFGRVANIPTGELPPFVFYMSGIIVWTFFANNLINNADIFSKNAQLFSKVYFPRIVMPIAIMLSGAVTFCFQLAVLLAVSLAMWLAGQLETLSPLGLLGVPLLMVYVGAVGMGVGLITSAMTVRYRDLAFAITFATQLWMFLTPVVYPVSQVPETLRIYFYFNPMSGPVETMRAWLFGGPAVDPMLWLVNIVISTTLLVLGLIAFSRAQTTAMDTV